MLRWTCTEPRHPERLSPITLWWCSRPTRRPSRRLMPASKDSTVRMCWNACACWWMALPMLPRLSASSAILPMPAGVICRLHWSLPAGSGPTHTWPVQNGSMSRWLTRLAAAGQPWTTSKWPKISFSGRNAHSIIYMARNAQTLLHVRSGPASPLCTEAAAKNESADYQEIRSCLVCTHVRER